MSGTIGSLFERNHVRSLGQRWFVVVNDVVGGWAITNADLPLSSRYYHVPIHGCVVIADLITKDAAEHIVRLHNQSLDSPQ